jgi:hypothetical protein
MSTIEVKVLDGTVYTLKDSVSAGAAIEYIKTFMTRDDVQLPEGEVTKEKTFGQVMLATCKNMEDVEWLLQHVIVKPSADVPLHHAYELIAPMRKAIRFAELMDVVAQMRQEPDPDFPEQEEKN